LIPSKDVKYPDKFVVDSFTTSVQCLICHSRRIRKLNLRTERLYRASEGTKLLGLVAYIVVEQGIIATSEPEIRGTPQIQEGAWGSALLQVQKANGEDVLQKSEISGFMHLQSIYNTQDPPPLLCYCDSIDELIEYKWKIVSVGEKH
jgi:hypothetical protein